MLAIYGELLMPARPVEYIIPLTTIYELEEFLHSPQEIMRDPDEEKQVREVVGYMIKYFQDPFKRKKMEKSLVAPWSTITFPYSERVSLTVMRTDDNAMWGEIFDPVETELLLAAMKAEAPLLTDQVELEDRMLEFMVPVQFYDIDDFEFAVEQGISPDDWLV
ncbi:ADP-heptose synthase [Brevibacillus dissolubilis]|uniref:ADP-heptose synthase n=1 Tax=Brevibacillus dissolubilis TaxID=1844116 RepID=UPI0021004BE9|nr:ADP-heptose synthase [Brevibacillus dissolubilis]